MDAPLLALARRRVVHRPGERAFAADTENMHQLVQLRWLAVLGQLVTILVVAYGMRVPLPVAPMLAVVAVAALFNFVTALMVRRRQATRWELLLALLFDVGSLSLQLYFSGGANNPFVSLYLLQVVLGAILLERWAAWVIVGVTGLSFALLAGDHRPLRFPANLLREVGGLYTLGSWLCFALVGTLLLLFVTRITRNLRLRDERFADLRQQAAEEDHLVRMGLFASGAAHELGTPLATLSVILGDWQHMRRLKDDPELVGEIGEMQAEVQRCKAIVTDILHSVGENPGGAAEPADVRQFLRNVTADWRTLHGSTALHYADDAPDGFVLEADPALRQAIWNVLDNAAEVSPDCVDFAATVDDGMLVLTVTDRGPGFPAFILHDFGTPHRSTKGAGHGVGLFLVTSVVRRLRGTVTAGNRPERGAEVTIRLPVGVGQESEGD